MENNNGRAEKFEGILARWSRVAATEQSPATQRYLQRRLIGLGVAAERAYRVAERAALAAIRADEAVSA